VLQRITQRIMAQGVAQLVAAGVAVVMDIDDDLAAVDPSNPAFTWLHPRNERLTEHSWRHLDAACRAATLVTVSTPALLPRYAAHGRGVVLPNCVPARYLRVPRTDSGVVGWPAALRSHPADPAAVRGAVARFVRAGGTFGVVGRGDGCARAFGLDREVPSTGDVAFGDWPATIARLGVGIAPLAATRFNQAKSWLKALELAAVGVPWVGSASSPEYARLHAQGCGRLAASGRDWHRELARLAASAGARAELSAAGRRVAAGWTVEEHAGRWWQAWQQAYSLRQRPAPAAPLDPAAAARLTAALRPRLSVGDDARARAPR
jgi:hypothetical protein